MSALNLKQLLLIAILLVLTASNLIGQERQRDLNETSILKRIENLKKDLALTDEQVQKITPILEANRKRNKQSRDDLRKELKADRQNRRAMMGQMRKATAENQQKLNASLKEILTKEQFEKLQEIQKKQREEMMKKRQNGNKR